jgi:bifunctional enzyme CysN/CysC
MRKPRPPGATTPARAGALPSPIGNDYQPPTSSELTIDTSTRSVTEATDEIERMLAGSGILFDELVDLAANI